eukprot:SAG11_NODE_16545_length_544_cov_1.505618_1_plen_44_part_10
MSDDWRSKRWPTVKMKAAPSCHDERHSVPRFTSDLAPTTPMPKK